MGALVFLDFETTGMSLERDVITDIGLLRVAPDGGRETWGQLVNLGMRIPPAITALTGISDAMVSGAPGFASVAGELVRRCDGALIVAHNARFDIGFLTAGLRRCGVTRRTPHVCSVRVAKETCCRIWKIAPRSTRWPAFRAAFLRANATGRFRTPRCFRRLWFCDAQCTPSARRLSTGPCPNSSRTARRGMFPPPLPADRHRFPNPGRMPGRL